MQALVVDDPIESTIYRLALADLGVEVSTPAAPRSGVEPDLVFAGIRDELDLLLLNKLRTSMPRAKLVACVSPEMEQPTGCDAILSRSATYGDLHAAIHNIVK